MLSSTTSISERFNINNLCTEDKQIITDSFNTYFTNIGVTLANKIKNSGTKTFKSYLDKPSETNFNFTPVTEIDVKNVIKQLKSKSSQGADGLSDKLLKSIENIIVKSLTLITNQCIETGVFPDKLKIAKVVPLYKKDDETLIENYRPVSILPAISKVIEKIMFRQIYEYFTINNLFYKSQYGFRQKHSTEFAAYELLDRDICELDKGKTHFCVFLDLSKAFDTINHSILLHKLNYYGFRRGGLNLLNSYLWNRKQYVQFGGTKSSLSNIMTGVPQGSILGPLVFIIYMNDINKASFILRLLIYADDTTL